MKPAPSVAAEFESLRPFLFSIAYRMTKSTSDAADLVQDIYLETHSRAAGIQSLKSYTTRALINRSIDLLEKRKRTAYPGIDLPEPLFTTQPREPYFHDVSFGLLLMLQKLSPQERAVFILRESFQYSYDEIAELLETSVEHCRQLLHRGKEKLGRDTKRFDTSPADHQAFTRVFMEACQSGDTGRLITLLKEQITIYSDGGGKAAAALNPIHGLQNVLKFLNGVHSKRAHELEYRPVLLNGQPAVIYYALPGRQVDTILVTEGSADGIETLYFIRNPDKLRDAALAYPPGGQGVFRFL